MWRPKGNKSSQEESRREEMKYLLIRDNKFESKN